MCYLNFPYQLSRYTATIIDKEHYWCAHHIVIFTETRHIFGVAEINPRKLFALRVGFDALVRKIIVAQGKNLIAFFHKSAVIKFNSVSALSQCPQPLDQNIRIMGFDPA